VEADAQERAAQSEYDATRQRVIDKLKQTPEYQHAAQAKQADASKLSSIKATDPTPAPEKTEHVAEAKLAAAKSVTDMENDALSADPQAMEAKEKLDAAVAKRSAIRAKVLSSLPTAPAVKH
jgi:hypothetical protein